LTGPAVQAPPGSAPFVPSRVVARFDEFNLAPGQKGKRFNASLMAWKDGYLLAYRDGWEGSEVHVATLDAGLNPLATVQLRLRHVYATYGREDPRMFLHKGQPHVAYVGVTRRGQFRTHVLFARLSESLVVEDLFYPRYPNRQNWEKNQNYWDRDGELYAVYRISDRHKVLRIRSNDAALACESFAPGPWAGGEMRGGASPVRVGGEWFHFFHDSVNVAGVKTYRTGLYTFSPDPPFQPLRIIPYPILTADVRTKPQDQYCAVEFVCGAVLKGDEWLLSHGTHDRYITIHEFSRDDLESRLIPVER